MNERINSYERQYVNALKTIQKLQITKAEIDSKLKSNPVCSHLLKELRAINLDITITLNEIEHIETYIHENKSSVN
ncbi:hypothetical protein [Flavobacterium adhaerens]|uniref:hypothetical protein n=1 Tax=Flavobacterium adhaerens TaxID=3149043 RepID=UPI0032B5D47C